MNAVTDKELDAFYGVEATEQEIKDAIERQTKAIDADDLTEIVHANTNGLVAAILDKDAIDFMATFRVALRQLVADRASIEIYGRHGVITYEQVKL